MASTNIDDLPDRIGATFNDRNIFITGGTGFLGKVIIEKFLRVLPDIGQLYLLVRPKYGKDPSQRLEDLLNNPVSMVNELEVGRKIK